VSFINTFISFPLHIKRILIYFVYLYVSKPYFIFPSLEEDDMTSSCIVNVDLVSSPQPIHTSEICIGFPLEFDHPSNLEGVEHDSKPSHISLPYTIYVEPSHLLVKSHIQPISFQDKTHI
jgi:hypothetical protein